MKSKTGVAVYSYTDKPHDDLNNQNKHAAIDFAPIYRTQKSPTDRARALFLPSHHRTSSRIFYLETFHTQFIQPSFPLSIVIGHH